MILSLTTLLLIFAGIVAAHVVLNVALRFLHQISTRALVPAAVDMRFVAGSLDHKSSALRGWCLELEHDSHGTLGRRSTRQAGSYLMIEKRLPLQLVSNDVRYGAGV